MIVRYRKSSAWVGAAAVAVVALTALLVLPNETVAQEKPEPTASSPLGRNGTLWSRIFIVPDNFLQLIPATPTPQAVQGDGDYTVDVRRPLNTLGIIFPAGAVANFDPRNHRLHLEDTLDQMKIIQALLMKIDPRHWRWVLATTPPTYTFIGRPDDDQTRAVMHKLEGLLLDVDFNKADVAVVLQAFNEKSKAADPDKQGVRFVLDPITPQDHVLRAVSITLSDDPLVDLLGYVAQQTNLQPVIENGTVHLRP